MPFRDVRLPLGQVRVWEAGREGAPPVLLLHGGGVDHARLSWEPTMQRLAALGCHALAPDFSGYGDSPYPQRPVTLAYLEQVLTELLTALGLQDVVLCGISMGGGMALSFALRHPDRVKALVLVGSYGLSSAVPGGPLAALLVRFPQAQCLSRWLSRSPALLDLTLSSILRRPEARRAELRALVADAMSKTTPAWNDFQRAEVRASGLQTNFAPQLRRLKMPILVFHGLEDFTVPSQDVEKAFAGMPNAEVHFIPQAGHWTQRDASTEFHRQLAHFLFKENL